MGDILKKRLKMKDDIPLRESVDLNIKLASAVLERKFEIILEKYGITVSQFNVLRILKGVYPEGHARCDIALRMIERSPDLTRLIDKLENQELVERERTKHDRRMSITRITKKGIKLVEVVKPLVDDEHNNTTMNLTDAECRQLSNLLEKYYKILI